MVLEDTQHRIIPQISSSESDNDEFDCPRPIYPWSQFRSKIGILIHTLGKHNFSITQILREIDFADSRNAKSAVFL